MTSICLPVIFRELGLVGGESDGEGAGSGGDGGGSGGDGGSVLALSFHPLEGTVSVQANGGERPIVRGVVFCSNRDLAPILANENRIVAPELAARTWTGAGSGGRTMFVGTMGLSDNGSLLLLLRLGQCRQLCSHDLPGHQVDLPEGAQEEM